MFKQYLFCCTVSCLWPKDTSDLWLTVFPGPCSVQLSYLLESLGRMGLPPRSHSDCESLLRGSRLRHLPQQTRTSGHPVYIRHQHLLLLQLLSHTRAQEQGLTTQMSLCHFAAKTAGSLSHSGALWIRRAPVFPDSLFWTASLCLSTFPKHGTTWF